MFTRLRERLGKTRTGFFSKIVGALSGRTRIDDDLLEELEEILIGADIGVETSLAIVDELKEKIAERKTDSPNDVLEALRETLLAVLEPGDHALRTRQGADPHVILVAGVNGSGKTTTIGKLASHFVTDGKSVILGAADTFRAAATEQLAVWSERAGVPIVKHQEGADPAAVAFDAADSAVSKNVDYLIVDTAGRLHTKVNLMEEIKKIQRVIAKRIPGAPHEVLLVIDANTGQNGLAQATHFTQALNVTGIVLTKLDGTAKGGIAIAIQRQLGIPIKLIGVGEGIDDLRPFDPEEFIDAILPLEEE